MKKILFLLIFSLIFSCASFQKDLINPQPLNPINLNQLNGEFEIVQNDFDSINKNKGQDIWIYNNLLTELNRKLIKDTLKIKPSNDYHISLKVVDDKNILISYFENNMKIHESSLKTKLKKDGYLYLKNKNFKTLFIPYVFGAIDIKKSRFALSKEGNLIMDISHHRSGALFLVGFLDFNTWKYRREYQKIN